MTETAIDHPTPTDSQLWEVLESVNWVENKDVPCDMLKLRMMKSFPKDLVMAARGFMNELYGKLRQQVIDYEEQHNTAVGNYGGPETFEYMLTHVIGMGREKYTEIMGDVSRLNGLQWYEGFRGAFPYEHSYIMLDPEHHKAHAATYLAYLEIDRSPANAEITDELKERLEAITNGDFEKAVKGLTKKDYDRFYQFRGNSHSAGYANILFDAVNYMFSEGV